MRAAVAFVVIASFAFACGAQTSRVDEEIARLELTLKSVEASAADLPQDVQGLFEAHRGALDRAKKAASYEYKLYRLRDAFVGIETLSFLAREKSAAESVERFEQHWRKSAARFDAKPPKARGTLVQRALIESASTRAGRLYRASLPYAKAAKPWSGAYYLGEAEANLRFRDFVLSLAAENKEASPSREQIASMLDSLERMTLEFFGNDVTNQSVVPVSVRLKESHELLDAGRLDGATLLLVEARAALSRRGGPRGSYPQAVAPTGSVVSLLQAWSDDEQAPMKEALRDEVVPFYGALVEDRRSRLSGQARVPVPHITVTLVRWPYT